MQQNGSCKLSFNSLLFRKGGSWMIFNEILKKLRKGKGISQEELSEILDVSRQSISKYENGTS